MYYKNLFINISSIIFEVVIINLKLFIWGLGIGDWGLGPIPNPQSPSN